MSSTIIVTGTATGIGLAVVRNLLSRPDANSFVFVFTVRSSNSSSTEALQKLVDDFNNNDNNHLQQSPRSSSSSSSIATKGGESNAPRAEIRRIDLASQESVREFSTQINVDVKAKRLPRIRALVLNAAIHIVNGYTNRPATTNTIETSHEETDVELHFQVNVLSNLMLSLFLLESFDETKGRNRIVYLGSWAHDPAVSINSGHKPRPIHWRDDACEEIALVSKMPRLSDEDEIEKTHAGQRRYGSSKLWLIMEMAALQRRLSASTDPALQNISVVGVDPGGVLSTGIIRHANLATKVMVTPVNWYAQTLGKYLSPNGMWRTEPKSAQDVINAALDARPAGQDPFDLYLNGSEVGKRSAEALDVQKQDKLFIANLRFAKVQPDETILKL